MALSGCLAHTSLHTDTMDLFKDAITGMRTTFGDTNVDDELAKGFFEVLDILEHILEGPH